ncbi:receptor-like protein EIX2 [Senna tora]|uniref:Receptor-like protein EIX2 n=1 Tax=Senna tora TaxID=362788 RepID=A0A834WJ77_9FABA|nr:receptor-like protein EIX2 [Senna tora]
MVLLFSLFAVIPHKGLCSLKVQCNEKDHHALLNFKNSIIDPSSILSSWSNHQDCCEWAGIQCSNTTGRLTALTLPCYVQVSGYGSQEEKSHCLTGELNPSLLQFEFLNHLDLSNNDFKTIHYDSSSCANSSSSSNLHYLDLSYNDDLQIDNLQWLSCFSSLKYVSFSGINLHRETNWLYLATKLPLLSELHLSSCKLRNISSSLQYANFSSLQVLDLSQNDFGSVLLPNWLFNLSVDFSSIDLSGNSFHGQLPEGLLNLRKIKSLNLNDNKLSGPIPNWLGRFELLQYLKVSENLFEGPIPSTLGNLSSLISLDVSSNQLNGSLPESLGQLLNLEELSLGDNFLRGIVSERNFVKLSNLKNLYMGSPEGFMFDFDSLWIPPFQLEFIQLEYYMSPKLPSWLYTQTSLKRLVITNSTISFESQDKFWNLAAQVKYLSLQYNTIDGDISIVLLNSTIIILESNNLKGSLPRLSENVVFLRMLNNSMTGSISSLLCQKMNGTTQLQYLKTTDNVLSGGLSDCWMNWKKLVVIKLGRNNLTGTIPSSMGFLSNLRSLCLTGNNLYGEIPQSFQNCQKLNILDLRGNKFSGKIPNWKWPNLNILILRSNDFSGNIPSQICHSSSLTILDLAYNRISGSIPSCLSNMKAMTFTNASNDQLQFFYRIQDMSLYVFMEDIMLLMKGQELNYVENLKLPFGEFVVPFCSMELSGMLTSDLLMCQGQTLCHGGHQDELCKFWLFLFVLEEADSSVEPYFPRGQSGVSFGFSVLFLAVAIAAAERRGGTGLAPREGRALASCVFNGKASKFRIFVFSTAGLSISVCKMLSFVSVVVSRAAFTLGPPPTTAVLSPPASCEHGVLWFKSMRLREDTRPFSHSHSMDKCSLVFCAVLK